MIIDEQVDGGPNSPSKPTSRKPKLFLVNEKQQGYIYMSGIRLQPGEGILLDRDHAKRLAAKGNGSAIFKSAKHYEQSRLAAKNKRGDKKDKTPKA